MSDEKDLKAQRDRFIAFAFASADLFLEVSGEGRITYAMGAAKGMTGIDDKTLMGKNWLEIFSPYEQSKMQVARDRAKPGHRCGPGLIQLSNALGNKQAVFTGFKMPGIDKFYIALGVSNDIMRKIATAIGLPTKDEIMNRDIFADMALDSLHTNRHLGSDMNMTMFDFGLTQEQKDRFGQAGLGKFTELVEDLLIAHSHDKNAGALGEGIYTVLHDRTVTADDIRKKIIELSQQNDPTGQGLEVKTKTVNADVQKMSKKDISRALIYTIHEFEKQGTELTIETLNAGLQEHMSTNSQKIKEFQGFIERVSFNIFFQPIIDLKTQEVSHYEILTRFENGDTQQWVRFGEDVGLAAEFDIAVCERAINYIKFKAGGTRTKFSLNLSGQSISDDSFTDKLRKHLSKVKGLSDRLMFEITESTNIENLEKVNEFVKELQHDGYKIALDDFGAGSASFRYLQGLNVNYVKIDGKYTRRILDSERDALMIKNLANMCQDLGVEVIAEYVEQKEQIKALLDMGIRYGQGYLFAKPGPKPDYTGPKF